MNQSGGTWWRSPGWPVPAWIHGNAPYLSHAGLKVSEMLGPNVPPIEMRAPGPRSSPPASLAGLGIISVPAAGQAANGGSFYSTSGGGPIIGQPTFAASPPNVVQPASVPQTGTIPTSTTPQQVNPVWYDQNGNVITSAVCGSVYNMTFPGYEGRSLYVIQTRNGAQQFSGAMAIPVLNYASKCNQDEGLYHLSGYDPTSGNLIGQGDFTVLPPGTASSAPSSTGTTGATVPASPPGQVPTAPSGSQAVGMTPSAPAPPTTTMVPATTSVFSSLSGVDWILIGAVVIALLQKK